MRIAVLILGILGGLGAGVLGVLWLLACQKDKVVMDALRSNPEIIRIVEFGHAGGNPASQELAWRLREYDRRSRAYPFLLAALALGVAGGALGFLGRGFSGAALMLAAVIGPAILNPMSLMFTFLLIVGAGLSFFVRPRERPAPRLPRRPAPQLAAE
jgi:hypothetical protein